MYEKKESVLILSPFFKPNIGGVETHLDDLSNYLNKNNYKTFVLTYQPLTTKSRGKKLERNGSLEIRRMKWFGYNLFPKLESHPVLEWLYLFPGLFLYSFLFMLKNSRKIDVIHAHGLNAALIGVILKRIFNKRLVLSTHAIYDENNIKSTVRFINPILNKCDKILTLSDGSTRQLIRYGVGKDKIARYTYWVSQSIFKPYDKKRSRDELGLNYDKIILFVGRLIEIKGIKLLVNIAKKMKDVHFVFIGTGPLESWLKDESKRHANIHFIGKIENHKIPKYYSIADFLCVPSLYEEGFGRVILEAMSCGLPVIGSNKGGIPEVINKSVGVLFQPTEADLKKVINGLYDKNGYKELALKCQKYAKKHFSENNGSEICNFYKRGN